MNFGDEILQKEETSILTHSSEKLGSFEAKSKETNKL